MTPIEIQAELKKRGITQKQLAKKVKRSQVMVFYVIHKQRVSNHIMHAVADAIGRKPVEVFPEYYKPKGRYGQQAARLLG